MDYDITNLLQSYVHLCGNKFRASFQSMFTNISLFSPRILKGQYNTYKYPNDKGIDDYLEEIIRIQLLFAKFFSQGLVGANGEKRLPAFPVVTLCIPNDDIGEEELIDKDNEFIDKVLGYFSKYNNINIYKGSKLSMCCRLLIDKEQPEIRNSVSSLGVVSTENGTDIFGKTFGSLRVITLDLPAIMLEIISNGDCPPEEFYNNYSEKDIQEEYFKQLKNKLDMARDILISQRHLIALRDKQGMFSFSKVGWIDYSTLNSTFGALGLYEAAKLAYNGDFTKNYEANELDFANEIIKFIDKYTRDMSKEYNIPFSAEVLIPGESMAFRMADRDHLRFDKIMEVPYTELSNQYSPLTLNINMQQKLYNEDYLNKDVPTTGICHININGSPSPEQNIKLHRTIWEKYPNICHYAINSMICICENGHMHPECIDEKCIECGGKIVDKQTRAIGYFKSVVKEFGKRRKEEALRRVFFKN
jgi:anaerobic ribonucleoside-triphosphate reductase